MSYAVDFVNVSTVGLESSSVAAALAGLRANEARYFKNKYDHVFTVESASNARSTIDWVHRILGKNATSSTERELPVAPNCRVGRPRRTLVRTAQHRRRDRLPAFSLFGGPKRRRFVSD